MNDHPRSDPLRKQATFSRLLTALGASLFAVAAVAAPPGSLPIELAWDGPPSCPASDDIDRDVRRFLGDATLPETLPTIAARVSVRENSDGRFEVRMLTTSGEETRERALRTETCDEARDLVAFLIALLIDPQAREPSRSPAASEPAAASEPPVAKNPPAATTERAPAPRPPPERGTGWFASLAASAESGILPGGSVGGELRAGAFFSGWSIEGRGAAWLPRDAESSSVPGAGGKFTLFEGGILGCLRGAPWGSPFIQGCAGPMLLSLAGEGYGVRTPGSDEALFAAAAAEVALLVAISRQLSLRPALGALVPFSRPTFAIHDVGTIHRPSAVAARASLGLEVRF